MCAEGLTQPEWAERWFTAPRNPLIPSPSTGDIVASRFGYGGDGVARHDTFELPPPPAAHRVNGGLFLFDAGFVFLPAAATEAHSLIESMESPVTSLLAAVAEMVLPLGSIILEAARDVAIEELVFGGTANRRERSTLDARWQHPDLVSVPAVDVVETVFREVRGRGLFAKSTGYLGVRAVDDAGAVRDFALSPMAGDLAGGLFTVRFARELEYCRGAVARRLSDFDGRARTALAALGLEIAGDEVSAASLLAAIRAAMDAGKTLEGVTTGQVSDAITGAASEGWRNLETELGPRLASTMAEGVLDLLAPMLQAYRLVPAMAHQLEVVEQVAAGQQDRAWTPAWKVAAYNFNFRPGERP